MKRSLLNKWKHITTWQHIVCPLLGRISSVNVHFHRDVQLLARILQRHAERSLLKEKNTNKYCGNSRQWERIKRLCPQQWQQKIDYHNLFAIILNCFLYWFYQVLLVVSHSVRWNTSEIEKNVIKMVETR